MSTAMNTKGQAFPASRALPVRELPPEFGDLAHWSADWALGHERERMAKLLSVSVEDLRPFYEDLLARMPAIKEYLDQFPLNAMPPEAAALFDLALTFMETAHVIDLRWKTTDIEDKFPSERFRIKSPF
jgi:hypothetical protein